jgi:hypothetical protein
MTTGRKIKRQMIGLKKVKYAGEGDRTLDLRIAPEFSGEVTVGMNRRVD